MSKCSFLHALTLIIVPDLTVRKEDAQLPKGVKAGVNVIITSFANFSKLTKNDD
jgi:hypothetical protein